MDVKELRIGNLINSHDGIVPVIEIDSYHNSIVILDVDERNGYLIDSITPIPLTEEWLVKFGFEYHGSGISISWDLTHHLVLLKEKDGFYPYIEESPEMSSLDPGVVFLKKIECVHQLQNLYYALSGKELEITQTA